LTSGTTSGTAGSPRQAELLSTTQTPARTAPGAQRRLTVAPAEKRAACTDARSAAAASRQTRSWPRKGKRTPAERPLVSSNGGVSIQV